MAIRYLVIIGIGQCLFSSEAAFSQVINGTVKDQESSQSIPYVNLGIADKNLGTITDENGRYQLSSLKEYLKDTITFQHVSYETKQVPVKDFILSPDVFLTEKVATLDEVRITSRKPKQKKIGIKSHNPLLWGYIGIGKDNIWEIAQEIKTNKTLRILDLNIFFRIYEDTLPLKYRVRLYTSKGGTPDKLIGQANIIKEGIIHGWNKIDLASYNLVTEGDFFASIEFFPISDDEMPFISAGAVLISGNRYSREVSLGTWNKAQGGYTMYITGEY